MSHTTGTSRANPTLNAFQKCEGCKQMCHRSQIQGFSACLNCRHANIGASQQDIDDDSDSELSDPPSEDEDEAMIPTPKVSDEESGDGDDTMSIDGNVSDTIERPNFLELLTLHNKSGEDFIHGGSSVCDLAYVVLPDDLIVWSIGGHGYFDSTQRVVNILICIQVQAVGTRAVARAFDDNGASAMWDYFLPIERQLAIEVQRRQALSTADKVPYQILIDHLEQVRFRTAEAALLSPLRAKSVHAFQAAVLLSPRIQADLATRIQLGSAILDRRSSQDDKIPQVLYDQAQTVFAGMIQKIDQVENMADAIENERQMLDIPIQKEFLEACGLEMPRRYNPASVFRPVQPDRQSPVVEQQEGRTDEDSTPSEENEYGNNMQTVRREQTSGTRSQSQTTDDDDDQPPFTSTSNGMTSTFSVSERLVTRHPRKKFMATHVMWMQDQ